MVKAYFYLWLVIAAIFGAIFLTGNLTLTMLVVFGFIAFGVTFMGMMGVLPAVVTHETHRHVVEQNAEVEIAGREVDRITKGVPIPIKAA
jgi:hypothetical protein